MPSFTLRELFRLTLDSPKNIETRITVMHRIFILGFALSLLPVVRGQEVPQDEQLAQLAGVWKIVSAGGQGKLEEGGSFKNSVFSIEGNRLTIEKEPVVFKVKGYETEFVIQQDPTNYQLKVAKAARPTMDWITPKGMVLKGIYELRGDELKVCLVNWITCLDKDGQSAAEIAEDKARPGDFTTKAGDDRVLYILKRVRR